MFEKLRNQPLIGQSAEAKFKREQAEFQKYFTEMSDKLADWEIANSCIVEAQLITPKTPTTFAFQSVINFRKLDAKQLEEYKQKINEGRNIQSKEVPK